MEKTANSGHEPRISIQSMSERDRSQQRTILERNAALAARFGDDRRAAYAAMCAMTPTAAGVRFSEVAEADVKGWWAMPESPDRTTAIFFIHGGGYHLGDAQSYRGFASQIAARTGRPVFAVDYPLAPERRFPAAHDAVVRAREWLLATGVEDYALVGDSAGGGLALALLADDRAMPRASSVTVFSPWTDLALTGPSFNDPGTHDPVFRREILAGLAKSYLDGADPLDQRASPLYGIPDHAPPILVQAGTEELLLDDARRYAQGAVSRGADVTLELFEGMHHVFQRDAGHLGIADQALDQAGRFIVAHWTR